MSLSGTCGASQSSVADVNNDAGMGSRKLVSKPLAMRWQEGLMADIDRDWADSVLLFCFLITGLLDGSSISSWESFVSMQTGNTIYLGLGMAAPGASTRWIKSGTSLVCFCFGSFLFSRFHSCFSPKRRWVLFASFLTQMVVTIMAAVVVTIRPKYDREDVTWNVLVPIALVAFQSCGQAVASRALKYNAFTSVVLTSIYCDLFSDADLFLAKNDERNRRVGAPILLLAGGGIGGLLFARSDVGIAGALWVAAVKLMIAVAWLFWPADPNSEDE